MPKRYTVQDSRSGKTITFDWHDDVNPPTEADMAEVSDAADTAHLGDAVEDAAKMGVLQDTKRGYGEGLPQQPFKDVRAFDKPIPPSLTQDIVRMGTRIAPAAAGSYYGGMAGAPFGPAGMAVGAAVGGFAGAFGGEAGGQYLENQPGDGQTRTEYNPKEMVLQGALGALPLPVKTASTLTRAALAHAAQGAVLGGSNAALSPLMEGQTPSLQDVLSNAGIGAVMGGATGGGLHWLHQPVAAAAPQATPTPPPAAFDPSRPSMATPTATPMGGGMPSGTESAMPGSVPVRGVPPPFVTEPVVNTVPTPEPRTPLAWALKPSEASSAGSWSGPVPGGMTQGMNGSWNWTPGHQGGTSTSMEIPLQDFEAAGAPDRRASMGRTAMGPEPPPPGPTTPPVDFGGGLPPGDPSAPQGGPAGPQAPPEPTYAPGEDNTTSGLRDLLKRTVAAGDREGAQKIAQEINRREQAKRAGGPGPQASWMSAPEEPPAPVAPETPIPGSMAEFAPTDVVGTPPHATGPEPAERTPLVQGQMLPGGVDAQRMAAPDAQPMGRTFSDGHLDTILEKAVDHLRANPTATSESSIRAAVKAIHGDGNYESVVQEALDYAPTWAAKMQARGAHYDKGVLTPDKVGDAPVWSAEGQDTPADHAALAAIPGVPQMFFRISGVIKRMAQHLYPDAPVTSAGIHLTSSNNGGINVQGTGGKIGIYVNPNSVFQHLGDNPNPRDVANGIVHAILHEVTHVEERSEGAKFTWAFFKNHTRSGLQQYNWWVEAVKKAISDPNNPDQLSAAFRDARAVTDSIGGRPGRFPRSGVVGLDSEGGSAALGRGEGPLPGAAGPGGGNDGAARPVEGGEPQGAPTGSLPPDNQRGFFPVSGATRLAGGIVGGLGGAAAAGPDATPEERLAAGLAGAAGGALLGHGLVRGLSGAAKLPEGSGIPELTAQREAQAAGAKPLQKPPLTDRIRTNMLDALDPVRVGLRDMEDKTGVKPTTDKGWENIYNIRGGQGGKVAVLKDRYQKVADDAKASKLQGWLTEHLNLIGMGSSLNTLSEKARNLALSGDQAGADAIWNDIRSGKALPTLAGSKMDEQKVANLRAEFDRRAGAKLPEIQRLGKVVTDLQKESLQTAMDAGLVRPEVGKALLKRGDYIPMNRIMDAVAEQSKFARGSSMQLKQQGVLFNLEGSERMNKDPLRAAYGRHAEIEYEAGRNEVAQNVASWRDLGQEWKDTFRDISRGGAPKRGEVAIGYYDKGERKTLAVPQALGTALMVANSTDIDGVFKAMGGFNQLLRSMAITMSPAFGVRNVLKDGGDTRIVAKGMSRYNPVDFAKFIGEWTGTLKDTWTHDVKWQEMMSNRAGYGTLARQFGDEALMAEPTKNPLTLIKNAAGHIGNTLEENTKSMGYQRLKAMGMSPTDAAYETRRNIGSPDFARKGAFGARMGVLQTFFNASLQGINRTVSALSDPKVLAPVLAGATLTALARDSWNRQFTDSDGTPTLDRVSDSDRRNYYVLVNPYAAQYEKDGVKRYQIAKVAKGHAAQLVTTPIEGLIDAFHGKGKGMGQLAADTVSNLLPGNTQLDAKHIGQSFINGQIGAANPALKAAVAQFANKDFAFGQPVVPKRLEDASAPQQWDERTSPTVVKATQFADNHLGMNLSPVRMQQGLRDLGLMSGPGEMALSLADKAIGSPASKKQPVGPDTLLQTPVIGPVARAFVGSTFDQKSRDQEEAFYEALEAGKTAIRDKNLALESPERRAGLKEFQIDPSTGKPANPDRLIALATSSAMIKASQQLSLIRKASREAQQSGADPALLSRLSQAEQKVIAGALSTVAQAKARFTPR